MRLFFIFALLIFTFQSCSTSSDDSTDMTNVVDNTTNNNTGTDTTNDNTGSDTTSGDMSGSSTLDVSYSGDFVSGAHTTQGMASVNLEKTILNFTNFKTSTGPVLNVYLATDTSANTYIDLGALKGIEGNFDYILPNNVDLDTYNYVIIWCVDYHVNFGYAVLK